MPSRQGGNSADWSHLSRPDSCRTSGSSEEVIAFLPGSRIAFQAIAARSAT